jgi:hypothetical protein
MQKTGKTLTAHEGTMGVMKETAESNRAALQQQVSANLDETRAIPATIPPLEQFNNWVKKVRQRFFQPFMLKMYHFTKTGSGQTCLGKLRIRVACFLQNEALQTKQMKLFERMNMLKKAYYASDASLPLKTQLELFMKEDVPE